MISFQEYFKLKENKNIERGENENSVRFLSRILSQLDRKTIVGFAYNAANSVVRLMTDEAKSALDLVKKWLDDEKINLMQLRRAADIAHYNHTDTPSEMADSAAGYAANAISAQSPQNIASFSILNASLAIAHVDNGHPDDGEGINNAMYEKNMNKFIQLAQSLVADKKHNPVPSNQWFNKNEKDSTTLAVWFDSLEEDGNQEIIDQIRKLVQSVDGVNPISNQDLASVIIKSDHKGQYLHYIQKIFK